MLLCGFTQDQIDAAVAVCNAGHNAGELRFEVTHTKVMVKSKEIRITGVLRLRNGRSPGARLSPSGRRSNSADWETHYVFMADLFAANPNGRMITMIAEYHGEVDFYFQCGKSKATVVGSLAKPCTFGSLSQRDG